MILNAPDGKYMRIFKRNVQHLDVPLTREYMWNIPLDRNSTVNSVILNSAIKNARRGRRDYVSRRGVQAVVY